MGNSENLIFVGRKIPELESPRFTLFELALLGILRKFCVLIKNQDHSHIIISFFSLFSRKLWELFTRGMIFACFAVCAQGFSSFANPIIPPKTWHQNYAHKIIVNLINQNAANASRQAPSRELNPTKQKQKSEDLSERTRRKENIREQWARWV